MSPYRNESSEQATLSFKNHERVTVFTQVASNENIKLVPEFVFKDTGKCPPKLSPPSGTHNVLTKVHTI